MGHFSMDCTCDLCTQRGGCALHPSGRHAMCAACNPGGGPIILPVKMPSTVDHPRHYNTHPSGVECITIVEHMSFNVGNAIKYLWRADEKGSPIEDLRKAAWYIAREIERRGNG